MVLRCGKQWPAATAARKCCANPFPRPRGHCGCPGLRFTKCQTCAVPSVVGLSLKLRKDSIKLNPSEAKQLLKITQPTKGATEIPGPVSMLCCPSQKKAL